MEEDSSPPQLCDEFDPFRMVLLKIESIEVHPSISYGHRKSLIIIISNAPTNKLSMALGRYNFLESVDFGPGLWTRKHWTSDSGQCILAQLFKTILAVCF